MLAFSSPSRLKITIRLTIDTAINNNTNFSQTFQRHIPEQWNTEELPTKTTGHITNINYVVTHNQCHVTSLISTM